MIKEMVGRLRRRQEVRVKRQHLAVMWALRACAGPATSVDVARLINVSPTAVLVHLDSMIERGRVRVDTPSAPGRQRTVSLTPAGEVFVADLVEDLLATANAWGGARPVGRRAG